MSRKSDLHHLKRLLGLEDREGNPTIPTGLPVEVIGKFGNHYIFPAPSKPARRPNDP